jgi:hypothetical protein
MDRGDLQQLLCCRPERVRLILLGSLPRRR